MSSNKTDIFQNKQAKDLSFVWCHMKEELHKDPFWRILFADLFSFSVLLSVMFSITSCWNSRCFNFCLSPLFSPWNCLYLWWLGTFYSHFCLLYKELVQLWVMFYYVNAWEEKTFRFCTEFSLCRIIFSYKCTHLSYLVTGINVENNK